MNRTPDVELVLRDYFADDGLTAPAYILNVVEGRIGREPQRRSWPFQRRTIVTTPVKLIAALAAVLVVAVVGYSLLPKGPSTGAPSSAPPSPTAASTPAVTPPPDLGGTLARGRHRIQPSHVSPTLSIVADVPAGWLIFDGVRVAHSAFPSGPALTTQASDDEGLFIGFMRADGLFSDPCHWDIDGTGSSQPGDVVVGPTVDDLVAALKANTSYTSSTPSPVTLGAFQGTELELQLPGNDVLSTCDNAQGASRKGLFYVFSGHDAGFYAQGPDSRWHLFIVDVAGARLITVISYFEGTPPADVAAAQDIVKSFEITP